jgi:transposase-like protein
MKKLKPSSQLTRLIRVNTDSDKISCKYCQSRKIRKYGLVEGVQRYFCNDCRRKFSPNDQLFKMKTPADQVSLAIGKYYQGFSINQIRDFLNACYTSFPSSKTVYSWVTKYTVEAVKQFKDYYVEVGDTWAIFDSTIKVNGIDHCCMDIIDIKTHYLLATWLSHNRKKRDVKELIEMAKARAGKSPRMVLTNNWKGNDSRNSLILSGDSSSIAIGSLNGADKVKWAEWVRDAFDERNRTLARLKSTESAFQFIEGFMVHHNYLKPDKGLNGQTPAEMANVHYTTKSWLDITFMANSDVKVLVARAQDLIQTNDTESKSQAGKRLETEHKSRPLQK